MSSVAHEVALGKSWSRKPKGGLLFTTLRYSFKPSSVNWKAKGKLDVSGQKADVTMPSISGAASKTVFTGSTDAHKTTTCMLIQDRDGTWRLERMNYNIKNLKTERDQPFLNKRR